MIESFLDEKRNYVKRVLMSKPDVIAHSGRSSFLFIVFTIICSAGIFWVWLKGIELAKMLPLDKIPFDSSDNILQIKVLCTTFLVIGILASLQLKKSVSYTLTTDYISIERNSRNKSSQIIMFCDIQNLSTSTGPLSFLTGNSTLKIIRNDNSILSLRAVPRNIADKVEKLFSQS